MAANQFKNHGCGGRQLAPSNTTQEAVRRRTQNRHICHPLSQDLLLSSRVIHRVVRTKWEPDLWWLERLPLERGEKNARAGITDADFCMLHPSGSTLDEIFPTEVIFTTRFPMQKCCSIVPYSPATNASSPPLQTPPVRLSSSVAHAPSQSRWREFRRYPYRGLPGQPVFQL